MTDRTPILADGSTDACRLIHGASDGWPGWYVERLGNFFLSQSEFPLRPDEHAHLARIVADHPGSGAYHKILNRRVRATTPEEACPRHVCGTVAPDRFNVRENGITYELSFNEGYSIGIFLDQRENRRRILDRRIAPGFALPDGRAEVLNTFAYTCAFSVCAAHAGYRATSLDLSRKYLDWGRRNFELNSLDPAQHDFIYGDAFDWMRRLTKKERRYDFIILDPPTFSQSKERGVFRAEKDYGTLITAALPLLPSGGILLASTNAAGLTREAFVYEIHGAVRAAKRRITREHHAGQPPDFPPSPDEPAYLKTHWLQIA